MQSSCFQIPHFVPCDTEMVFGERIPFLLLLLCVFNLQYSPSVFHHLVLQVKGSVDLLGVIPTDTSEEYTL